MTCYEWFVAWSMVKMKVRKTECVMLAVLSAINMYVGAFHVQVTWTSCKTTEFHNKTNHRARVCEWMPQHSTPPVTTFCKKKSRKSGGSEAICKHLLQGRSEENCEPLLCTDIQENTPRQWYNDDPLVPSLGLGLLRSRCSPAHSPSTKNDAWRY